MKNTQNTWIATHTITTGRTTTTIVMRFENDEGASYFTHEEWDNYDYADWTEDSEGNTLFLGQIPRCDRYEVRRLPQTAHEAAQGWDVDIDTAQQILDAIADNLDEREPADAVYSPDAEYLRTSDNQYAVYWPETQAVWGYYHGSGSAQPWYGNADTAEAIQHGIWDADNQSWISPRDSYRTAIAQAVRTAATQAYHQWIADHAEEDDTWDAEQAAWQAGLQAADAGGAHCTTGPDDEEDVIRELVESAIERLD